MNKLFKIIALFPAAAAAFLVLSAARASAAQLTISAPASTVRIGDEFLVEVFLDPEGDKINATAGQITFPQSALELEEIYENKSIVSLWLSPPHLDGGETVAWSGIIPGGFGGVLSPYYSGARPGQLFTLLFKARAATSTSFYAANVKTLLADGWGTPVSTRVAGAVLNITPGGSSGAGQTYKLPADQEPPLPFTPQVARDPAIFGGRWFVAFYTQDKETGVDYYSVLETRSGQGTVPASGWVEAASPYRLADQSLESYIYIRAVDKAGNERVAVIPPRYVYKWYQDATYWFILILIVVWVFFASKIKKRLVK